MGRTPTGSSHQRVESEPHGRMRENVPWHSMLNIRFFEQPMFGEEDLHGYVCNRNNPSITAFREVPFDELYDQLSFLGVQTIKDFSYRYEIHVRISLHCFDARLPELLKQE